VVTLTVGGTLCSLRQGRASLARQQFRDMTCSCFCIESHRVPVQEVLRQELVFRGGQFEHSRGEQHEAEAYLLVNYSKNHREFELGCVRLLPREMFIGRLLVGTRLVGTVRGRVAFAWKERGSEFGEYLRARRRRVQRSLGPE
jgi:hypothetical protein